MFGSDGIHFIEILVPVLVALVTVVGSVTVAKLNKIKDQVTNDHSVSTSPANLRVQMDQMQGQIRNIEDGHAEFRENMLMLITELRTVQKQNGELMLQLAEEDRHLASRIDHFIDIQPKGKYE